MDLAGYLRAHRETESAFARRTKLTKQMVNQYSRGLMFPRADRLDTILRATGGEVTAEDMLHRYQSNSGGGPIQFGASDTARGRQ